MKTTLHLVVLSITVGANLNILNAQWVQQTGGTTAMLTDVVMLDTTTAVAVGRNGSVLRTTNAGTTWIDIAAPLSFIQPWDAVSFFDTAQGIVVGDHGTVLTTMNGGRNWMWHEIPGGQKCLSALHLGSTNIYVGADSGWAYHSSDTGRTWTSEKISAWPIRALFIWRGTTIFGASKYALTPYSLCTQYVMSPPSWGETILTPFQGLGSEAFSGEFCNGGGAGFIVGVQGDLRSAPTILRKAMSDTGWYAVSTGINRDGVLFDVSAPSANVIYVCGTGGMIFKSTNGGDAWTSASAPTTRTLNAIYFHDEKRGFAVGDSGTILFTSTGGLTGIENPDEQLPTPFRLDQNYPNPFNPETNVEFQLPNAGMVKLVVFDLLGREVATLVNEEKPAGTYRVRFDASKLSSGVYFYRLQAGGFAATKKLLCVK